ncbi:MAG: LysM peptidoglycan-binding domain-containing protein [Candidatus Brocadiia bacterium]
MKMKEAQLLGVLAVIAAVIIAISMWGDGSESNKGSVQAQQPQEVRAAGASESADLDEWIWMEDESASEPETIEEPTGVEASVSIEGEPTFSQDNAVPKGTMRELDSLLEKAIDEEDPADIPLKEKKEKLQEPKSDDVPIKKHKEPETKIHVVKKGDTLSGISCEYYDTPGKWKKILEANQNILEKAEDLRPNMKLEIPPLQTSRAAGESQSGQQMLSAEGKYYTVQKGDSLWKIAKKVYGKGANWKKILKANTDRLDGSSQLKTGMELIIP